MAASRSPSQLAEIGAFIQRLYELGGYGTWKEFADDAKLSAPQLSDFQRGTVEPSGYNLFRLIQAAAARAGTDDATLALRLGATPASLLEGIREGVSSLLLGQAEILQSIDEAQRRERTRRRPAAQKKKAAARKAHQR